VDARFQSVGDAACSASINLLRYRRCLRLPNRELRGCSLSPYGQYPVVNLARSRRHPDPWRFQSVIQSQPISGLPVSAACSIRHMIPLFLRVRRFSSNSKVSFQRSFGRLGDRCGSIFDRRHSAKRCVMTALVIVPSPGLDLGSSVGDGQKPVCV